MIESLISNSRNTEVDGTTTQIIKAYKATTLNSDANLEQIFGPLETKSTLLSGAIARLTEKSTQKTNDEKRDERVDGLYYLLLSSVHSPKTKIREAALMLLEIFEQYGLKVKDESYTRESSLVNSLLNDYKQADALAAIADVPQCADYVAVLQTAQENFETMRLSFEAAQAQAGTQENASAIKKEVVEIINDQLVPYLNVMEQLNPDTYGEFAALVAELIATNNEVVKKRRAKEDTPEEETD